MRRSLVAILLIASLAANVWLGLRHRESQTQARQNAAHLAWGANYALNGLVQMVENPASDWESPGFRGSLLEMLEWATLYAQTAGSTVAGRVTNPYHQVATHLNSLSFEFSNYRSVAMRMVTNPGPVPAEQRRQFEGFAANLRAAGWPREQLHRDDVAGWAAHAEALHHLLRLETAR